MSERGNFALVRRPPSSVEKAGAGARRIQSVIVADTLALVKKRQATPVATKFRIGQYEWCEPDYRQILIWAEALGLKPEEVVERLLEGPRRTAESVLGQTRFEDGRLVEVCWDFDVLPLWEFEVVEALETAVLTFATHPGRRPRIQTRRLWLPKLSGLHIDGMDVTEGVCDLSGVPNLTSFSCQDAQIKELDLSKVPHLEHLYCWGNRLSELDLSVVPDLRELWCERNQISDLELSKVPRLDLLHCGGNRLSELDLSLIPSLNSLCCSGNKLSDLDLSQAPRLSILLCSSNRLSRLDLSRVSNLFSLKCARNGIAELALSKVPRLTTLDCSANPINILDIRPLAQLKELIYDVETTRLLQRPDQHF